MNNKAVGGARQDNCFFIFCFLSRAYGRFQRRGFKVVAATVAAGATGFFRRFDEFILESDRTRVPIICARLTS
jgi:hypothetical protein